MTDSPISASSAIPLYLDALRLADKSPNTIRMYKYALGKFIRILGKNDELSEANYIKFLQRTAHLANITQVTYRVPVCRLYEFHAPGVPVHLLTERYGKKKKKRHLQYNEKGVEKLIEYASGLHGDLLALRDRAFILTLADTGFRISEACNLLRSDIDFDRARSVIIGKGDKSGVVRYSPRALQAIRDYLSARAEIDGKSGRPLSSLPVFARHDKGAGKKIKPVKYKGMGVALRGRAVEAGISEEDEAESGSVTAHKLRHNYVTKIIRETKNPAIAQVLARHEDINTTMRYAHLDEQEIDSTYKEIFSK